MSAWRGRLPRRPDPAGVDRSIPTGSSSPTRSLSEAAGGRLSLARGSVPPKSSRWLGLRRALVNNVWSITSSSKDPSYNNFLLQPFLNYNFPGGLYFTSAPIITAAWDAPSSDRWTVPLGGGVGKIFHFGRLPVNMQLSAYWNVVAPDNGPDWQLRFQVQLLFPK